MKKIYEESIIETAMIMDVVTDKLDPASDPSWSEL